MKIKRYHKKDILTAKIMVLKITKILAIFGNESKAHTNNTGKESQEQIQ